MTSLRVGGELPAYILSNVNRWRQQMALPPISQPQLEQQATRVELPGTQATIVDLPTAAASGTGGPHAAAAEPAQAGPADADASGVAFTFDLPDGWTTGKQVVSRGGITIRYRAALDVVDGDQKAEITVSDFPGIPTFLLGNINRWRGQIGLGPVSQPQLDQQLQEFQVGEIPGQYIEMASPPDAARPETILAVIAAREGTSWFFKLKGDTELAERERERFQSFARSARFGN